jgi:hypothetical protein
MTGFRGMRSTRGVGVLRVVVLTTLGACGGGGGKASPDAGATGTPVELCSQLVSTICARLKSCNLVDTTTFDEAACVRSETVEFGCERAISTGFPTCVTDVNGISCLGLFSTTQGLILPPSCDEPVNTVPLSDPQTKCGDLAAADCQWGAACLGITPTATQFQNCVVNDFSLNDCGFATDVGTTYNQCLQDIPKAPCPPPDGGAGDAGTDGGGLPSCANAITYVN